MPTNAFFDQQEVGSRFLAMGGTGVALEGDVFSLCLNPASLCTSNLKIIGASYSELLGAGIRYSYFGGSFPLNKWNVGLFRLGIEDPFFVDEGGFQETSYGFSTAVRLTPFLAVGITGKQHSLNTVEVARGFSFDVGGQYSLGKATFGLVIQDIIYQLRYEIDGRVGRKKPNFVLGSSYSFNNEFTIAADITESNLAVGLEKGYGNIKLRTGYSQKGFVAGLGVYSMKSVLDYAFQPGFYGDEHRLSLSFFF